MGNIVAVNASPRKGWNTDILVTEAAEAAAAQGYEIQKYDLFDLERFTGCISCFGCKRQDNLGRCIYKDGLASVLEAIRNADGLIIGTPNYLGEPTSSFRALYERLLFQYITYKEEVPSYNTRKIPVLLIMTSNCPVESYEANGYNAMLEKYSAWFGRQIGPCTVFTCGDTLQVNDYSPFGWTYFDPAAKQQRRDEIFPQERAKLRGIAEEIFK